MREVFIGVDLGGTNVKIGCFDATLTLIDKTSIPAEVQLGPQSIVNRIAQAIEDMLTKTGFSIENITAVGIGSPGVIDIAAGIVVTTSNLNFENVPLRQMLSDAIGKPVILENDANVTCWGERVAGAGTGADDMVLITLGTGIGGGIVSNGELLHGFANNAAELGHMIIYPDGRLCGCGQKGCLEAYASANSTVARATEAIQAGAESSLRQLLEEKGQMTCKDIFDHLATGDRLAREITDDTAKALALLCVSMLHISGPSCIVFYGGMIEAGDLLLKPIKKFFSKYIWTLKTEHVELRFATLGADAGIYGTAGLAIHAKKQGTL